MFATSACPLASSSLEPSSAVHDPSRQRESSPASCASSFALHDLAALSERNLSPAGRRRLAQHLATCDACRTVLASWLSDRWTESGDAPAARRDVSTACYAYHGDSEPLRGAEPQLVLFVAAHAHRSSPQVLAREAARLRCALGRRSEIRIEACWATSLMELRRQLVARAPTIVHFVGRGEPGVVMQDEYGRPCRVSPRALARTIAASPRTRMVVFDACHSARDADAVRTAVDCVLGTPAGIGTARARAFAVRLYRALGRRQPVADAVAQAVATLRSRRQPETPRGHAHAAHPPSAAAPAERSGRAAV